MPTFLQMTYDKSRGFSLFEVLIAVAIFASSLIFILPQINRSENQIKKSLRELQSLNQTLYSYSKIKNRSYRLVLNIRRDNPSYWVEVKKSLKEKIIENQKTQSSSLQENWMASHSYVFFSKDSDFFSNEQKLPKGVFFDRPSSTSFSDTSEDILYIVYDPNYFSNPTTVLVRKGNDFTWTLFFNPLFGELKILEGEYDEKEIHSFSN